MKLLTQNEVARTAFKTVHNGLVGGQYPPLSKNTNKMCPYCKNENAEQITESYYLAPFKEWWGASNFTAMYCFCCEAQWSFGSK